MCLVPYVFARENDIILIFDSPEEINEHSVIPTEELAPLKIKLLTPDDLNREIDRITAIHPWGWNLSLKTFLKESGVTDSLLPDEKQLAKLRDLSHRKTTILFYERLQKYMSFPDRLLPVELFDIKDIENFIDQNKNVFLKAPWSSSGRGVVTNITMEKEMMLQWATGCLRKQGSVMAEKAHDKKADFASEWFCRNGVANFIGVSYFSTSRRGKYHENHIGDQSEILKLINSHTSDLTPELIDIQKKILEDIIAPYYDGPLGIDMLAYGDNKLCPCVEINLRFTMGHYSIAKYCFEQNLYNPLHEYLR